jgi:flagellar hook assembly protein FlgD
MSRNYVLVLVLLTVVVALVAGPRIDLSLNIYPNPFKTETNIVCGIPSPTMVSVVIYQKPGLILKTVHRGYCSEGVYSFTWDGRNDNGNLLPKGSYTCDLTVQGRFTSVKKIIIMK